MAFARSGLKLLAHTSGFNIWRYTTSDTAATVDSAQYFDNEENLNNFNVGDWIITTCNGVHGLHIVASNNGTDIDVLDAQITGTTDTD